MTEKIYTNCFLVENDINGNPESVYLGLKKRGFGMGLWNGAGGKSDNGEVLERTMLRELYEEFQVEGLEYSKRAEIEFFLREENKEVKMNAFFCSKWKGELKETEEMVPKKFDVSQIPYKEMWEGDREWLPIVLQGKKIRASFIYDKEGGHVEKREIIEVIEL